MRKRGCDRLFACRGERRQNRHTQAAVSTVGFVAGAALPAAGIALYLTAPNGSEVALAGNMVNGGGRLSVRTKW
jgi:phosphotransferase system  glucose/maltose/N-acetylglucosamine-specific IIC component